MVFLHFQCGSSHGWSLPADVPSGYNRGISTLQRAGKPSSWIDAADNVTKVEGLYKRLFYIFQGLKWAAPVYSEGSAGGGFSRASVSVRRKSEKVPPFHVMLA